MDYFGGMIDHCYDYAQVAKQQGHPIVGIMCEFTPREIILAAGGVPICLCGGSSETIAAAEQYLPANLCPLIKSTFGYQVTGKNPFLNWADLVVAETTCDGKKKMFELLGASKLMAEEQPPLTGTELLRFKSTISGIEADLLQYERALVWLRERKSQRDPLARPGFPNECRSRIRVLLTGVPLVHGAERVLELIEGCGAVVVCMENCTGLKPILEDVADDTQDPIRAIAQKYYHLPCSVMTPNKQRFQSLRELTEKFRPQCVIEIVWQACLTYHVESFQVRKLVEDELRLPYLKITTDYSPADSARIVSRVEALFETVRSS